MEALAAANGSVISATMFGALAGAGALPFPREAFERVIGAGDKGVAPSLKAFAAGFARAEAGTAEPLSRIQPKRFEPLPASAGHPSSTRW